MSNCKRCEHPVVIPEELRGNVTEIHTCEDELENQ